MGLYRPRNVTVQAVQFTGRNALECARFVESSSWSCALSIFVFRRDGEPVTARPGDWIIRGTTGHLFVVPSERFDGSYEPVVHR